MAQDNNRTVYTRESSATGWFVGIIVALGLLASGLMIIQANSSKQAPAAQTTTTK